MVGDKSEFPTHVDDPVATDARGRLQGSADDARRPDANTGSAKPASSNTETLEFKTNDLYSSVSSNQAGQGLRVGMAWNGADNLEGKTPAQTAALHDFQIRSPESQSFRWDAGAYQGMATSLTPESLSTARKNYDQLKAENPQATVVTELRYRDANSDYLPADSKMWLHGADGKIVPGYAGDGQPRQMLDIRNPQLQDILAAKAGALVKSGATDGIMLDWFNDGEHRGKDWVDARAQMVEKIRAAIGPDAKIFINTNDEKMPDRIARNVDGYYMESFDSSSPQAWQKITDAVDSAQKAGKVPFVETWPDKGQGREEENKMRATMTLVMTHAPDGYGSFADPNGQGKPEHMHEWYPFYDTNAGKSAGPLEMISGQSHYQASNGTKVDNPGQLPASVREYGNGTVVYNPMGNKEITVTFPTDRTRASDPEHKRGRTFTINPEDGDIFLKVGA